MRKATKELTEEQKQRLREWGRRGGRRPVIDKKNKTFSFRLREKDAAIFCKDLDESGLSIGEYIRQKMILKEDTFVRNREQEHIIFTLRELRKIGINVNQIAHGFNLLHKPLVGTDDVLLSLQKELKEVKEWLNALRVKQK